MTHEEFVSKDAQRIFSRMVLSATAQVLPPDMFVLYSSSDLERLPPTPGVYIAFNELGRCQYVGESSCVGRRIGGIGKRRELLHAKYIAVVMCDDERQMRATEFYYIGLLDPVFNDQLQATGKTVRAFSTNVSWDSSKRLWSINGSAAFYDRRGNVKQR